MSDIRNIVNKLDKTNKLPEICDKKHSFAFKYEYPALIEIDLFILWLMKATTNTQETDIRDMSHADQIIAVK